MKILGISGSLSGGNHDCSAALLIDGELKGVYEEERLDRQKHSTNFPLLSIHQLLNENGLTLDDIDAIGVSIGDNAEYLEAVKLIDPKCNKIPKRVFLGHHHGHICDVFFQSGFESSAVVIVDGFGDNKEAITIAHVKDNEIKILEQYDYRKSLGIMYSSASGYCGLGDFGEGKLMGLSSYGNDLKTRVLKFNQKTKDIDILYDTFHIEELKNYPDDDIVLSKSLTKFYDSNYFPYNEKKENMSLLYYINFAKTIQENYNEVFLDIIKYAKELTKEDNLCITGGCIQNCIGNNHIIEQGIFKNVFASPAPHDAGCASGYAYMTAHYLGETIINKRLTNSYFGRTYTDEEILKEVDDNVIVELYDENTLIEKLKKNKIVAWFQGGSEIGPRALGHRSILANPSYRYNLDTINNKIKHRENWRPLAPIVPSELFDLIFDVQSYDLTEFMLRTLTIKPEWQKKLCATCHIDNTTRPQRLVYDENPELYNLLMKYYNKMDIPCLINTSFNGKGEPIIETPKQAIEFLKTHRDLDSIIFNAKYVVSLKP